MAEEEQAVLNDFESNPDADFALLDINGRLSKHEPLWDEFEETQNELDSLAEDDNDVTAHENERTSFENRFFTLNGRAKKLIQRYEVAKENSKSIPASSESGSDNSSARERVENTVPSNPVIAHPVESVNRDNAENRSSINLQNAGFSGHAGHFLLDPNLPQLGLPSFSGTFDTWLGFRDTFNSIVHTNAQVPPIFKFHYLKSCVTGEAAEVIASLESSSENYEIAWNLLTDRYDNRKFIAESHVRALFNIPLISKEFLVRALLDKLQKHVRALRALKQPVDQWDLVLIHVIKDKLPNNLREKWEEFAGTSKIPTIKELTTFLERRAQIEITRSSQTQNNVSKDQKVHDRSASGHGSHPPRTFSSTIPSNSQNTRTQRLCPICQRDHAIYVCNQFLKPTPQERFAEVKNASLCVNCLRGSHRPVDCRLKGCRQCHKRHNSLLHFEQTKEDQVKSTTEPVASTSTYHLRVPSEVYLATAIVDIRDSLGKYQPCRIMLNGGAQSCTITNNCVSRLGLYKTPFEIPLLSLDHMQTNIKFATTAIFKSRFDNKKRKLDLLVVNQIADAMPSMPLDKNNFAIPPNIFLADPNFHEPAPVDIIIGAEFAYSFLRTGQVRIEGHTAVLQKTILGWIIAGRVYNKNRNTNNCSTKMFGLFNQVEKLPILWELDPVKTSSTHSTEEQACETHFANHVQRDDNGRYIVKLPFNEKIDQLADSRNVAFQRFYALERKFEKNPSLKSEYTDCIKNYLSEGHMSLSPKDSLDKGYYLPHHAVVKETSITTKTRVVFYASAKSASGISLNDCLMVGPTIQDDLFSIFTRFRSFLFALTADIKQMYRQIKVYPEDSTYQKIIWREGPNEPIKIYDLNRVTFGTASAPYIATRTLHQLSEDERDLHPIASAVLKRDFYVDDLLTGAQSL